MILERRSSFGETKADNVGRKTSKRDVESLPCTYSFFFLNVRLLENWENEARRTRAIERERSAKRGWKAKSHDLGACLGNAVESASAVSTLIPLNRIYPFVFYTREKMGSPRLSRFVSKYSKLERIAAPRYKRHRIERALARSTERFKEDSSVKESL